MKPIHQLVKDGETLMEMLQEYLSDIREWEGFMGMLTGGGVVSNANPTQPRPQSTLQPKVANGGAGHREVKTKGEGMRDPDWISPPPRFLPVQERRKIRAEFFSYAPEARTPLLRQKLAMKYNISGKQIGSICREGGVDAMMKARAKVYRWRQEAGRLAEKLEEAKSQPQSQPQPQQSTQSTPQNPK